MTDPTRPTEREQLEEQYEQGGISRQEYYQRKRVLLSRGEPNRPKATLLDYSVPGPSSYVPSASSVVGLGVVVLSVGGLLSGGFLTYPEQAWMFVFGGLGVIVGTLLIGAGVIAYGVRVGVMQAYANIRIADSENPGEARSPHPPEAEG